MKNFSQHNTNKDTHAFAAKRAAFLGIVAVLLVAVVILSVYSAVSGGTAPSISDAVSSTEDGKLIINDLYEGELTIPKFNIPLNTYDTEKFKNDNGLVTYDDPNASLGIDVSDYQGDIDWQTVKESGIDFAMIRIGYRGATRGKLNEDSKFQQNYEGAKAAGVQIGVYFFSQAVSVSEAEEEAGFVLQLLQDKELSYPVVFDWEVADVDGSRSASATGEQITSYASAFCKKISKAGYTAGVYFNRSLGYYSYDLEEIKDFDFWLAEYRSVPAFYYDFKIWQYSDNAQVQGIETPVDIDICFKKYA
ncbi:MAG: glycoside hydrolase family 25 protein [Hominenteromicrobium sp.]